MAAESSPSTPARKTEALQIAAHFSQEFYDGDPGWFEHYARHLAQMALERMQADETMAFEASTIASEFLANAIEHGRSLNDFAVVHSAAGEGPETIYVVTTNPAADETSAPGTERRGGLAANETNETSESGRGLWMTDIYTDHNWGQDNVVSLDKKRHEIITYAILSSAHTRSDPSSLYEDAA